MTIYQVTHKMVWLLQECRNVYYYDTTVGELSASEWQDVVDEIRSDFDAELKAQMVQDWQFYGIDRRVVDTAGLNTFSETPTAGALVGTHEGQTVPTQIALLISIKGSSTKPNKARSYLTGFSEDAVGDGLFSGSSRGAAETFVDLQSALNTGGTNPLTRVSAQWNTGHTQVIVTNDISGEAAVASQVPATQCRRRIGVGI